MKKHPTPKNRFSRSDVHGGHSTASPQEESSSHLELVTISSTPALQPPRVTASPELRQVRFGYFHPDAQEVFVVGSFNGWNKRSTPMKRDALGDWSAEVALPPGEHRYRLLVDGAWRDDPSAQQTAMNPYGGFDAVVVVS